MRGREGGRVGGRVSSFCPLCYQNQAWLKAFLYANEEACNCDVIMAPHTHLTACVCMCDWRNNATRV